jgi:hypothetical protein
MLKAIFQTFQIETLDKETRTIYYNSNDPKKEITSGPIFNKASPVIDCTSDQLNQLGQLGSKDSVLNNVFVSPPQNYNNTNNTKKFIQSDEYSFNAENNPTDKFIVIKVNRPNIISVHDDLRTDNSAVYLPETLKVSKTDPDDLFLTHIIVLQDAHYTVYFKCNNGWYLYNDLSRSTIEDCYSNNLDMLKRNHPIVTTHGTLLFYNQTPNRL